MLCPPTNNAKTGEVWIGAATAEETIERLASHVDDLLANIEDYE